MKSRASGVAPLRWIVLLVLGMSLACADAEPPVSPEALATLRRQWTAEVENADAALARDPLSLRHFSARGDAHLFLGKFAEAVADYRRMIELDPAQDAPHWRLGIALYFTRDWEKASAQFARYHAYDGRDRENGVWKFFADAQAKGVTTARREMLAYTEFDREPFPALYELLAGRLSREQFAAHLAEPKVARDRLARFFGGYYGGLFEETEGRHEEALRKVREAVALFTPEEAASGGPGFMWQVARLHHGVLAASAKPVTR